MQTYMAGICGGEGYGSRVIFVPCAWDEEEMKAVAAALKAKGWQPAKDLYFEDSIDARRICALGEIPEAIF